MYQDSEFRCFQCGYSTEMKSNMRRHIERNHINPKNTNKSVSCTMCNYKSHSRPQMKIHYLNVHNVDCRVQILEFKNMETFEEWKSNIEINDRSRYVRLRTSRRNKNTIHQTYICHRNGNFLPKGKGKRRLKKIGSNKINGCCPSQMSATVNLPSNTVTIKYISTHVGHAQEIERLYLSNSDRNMIAHTLSGGVSYEKIISNIRDNKAINPKDRLRLITRQDIANIARDFKVKVPVRHSRDVTQVHSSVMKIHESSDAIAMYNVHILHEGYSKYVTGGLKANCSCTLITGPKNVIVDTMTPWDGDLIKDELEVLGLTADSIDIVISTHGHSDHVGNNNLFLKAKYHIVGRCISTKDFYLDDPFDEEDEYIFDSDLKLLATPGHTLSCITVLVKTLEGQIAITGDLFEKCEDIDNESIWQQAGSESHTLQKMNRAKVIKLADFIIPGHGGRFKVTDEMRSKIAT